MDQQLPETLSFVDIETTGTSPTVDRIIEIGILRVEHNRVVKTYKQLINPEKLFSPFISNMTGISPEMLEDKPTFYQVKDEILELLQGSVFVAHNVRFDYGFLRQEFMRHGIKFTQPHFCTIRLFRALVPGKKRYNLDEVIAHFGIECQNRHRAFDDAKVLWDFYQISKKQYDESVFSEAVSYASIRPSLPQNIPPEMIDQLPEEPGVYIFRDETGTPLYIGKSVNIKERVLSHFSADYKSGIEMKIKQHIANIETIQTSGELGALLLESELIKTQQPIYNKLLRTRRRLVIAKESITKDNYKTVDSETVLTIHPEGISSLLGIYKSEKQLKNVLLELCTTHNLCPKLLGLEKGKGPCFSYQLHRCHGACIGKELPARYNLRFTEAFSQLKMKRWPFSGPIIIKEGNSQTGQTGYVLDQWCLVGKTMWDENGSIHQQTYEYMFDVDVYKILLRYLFSKNHSYKITQLTSAINSYSPFEFL